jgi:hypothetical protein
MNVRRLEEVFEECVTAYLEGRRSIQDSLQLYPAFASQLAPLLQTAVQFNESLSKVDPPAHVQERVRHRFLSDARARRQVRALTRGQRSAGLFSGLWQRQRFGFAGAAAAVAVLVVAVGSAAMLTGGGTTNAPGSVENITSPTAVAPRTTPASVTNIRAQTSAIRQTGVVTAQSSDIDQLVTATEVLASADQEEVQASIGDVTQALLEADSVLDEIVAAQPALAPEVQVAKDKLRSVAGNIGVDLDATPTATPIATPTPVATGETPTDEPTAEPTDQPTEAPTPEPTVVPPTDTPAPTPTPIRGLPGENP